MQIGLLQNVNNLRDHMRGNGDFPLGKFPVSGKFPILKNGQVRFDAGAGRTHLLFFRLFCLVRRPDAEVTAVLIQFIRPENCHALEYLIRHVDTPILIYTNA